MACNKYPEFYHSSFMPKCMQDAIVVTEEMFLAFLFARRAFQGHDFSPMEPLTSWKKAGQLLWKLQSLYIFHAQRIVKYF